MNTLEGKEIECQITHMLSTKPNSIVIFNRHRTGLNSLTVLSEGYGEQLPTNSFIFSETITL